MGAGATEKALVIVDVGHALMRDELGVGHIKKIPRSEQLDQLVPLLDIGADIGRIATVGF